MKRLFVVIVIVCCFCSSMASVDCLANNKSSFTHAKKKTMSKVVSTKPKQSTGAISKVKNAALNGFGWGLGREAAKEVINGTKKVIKKGVEKGKEIYNQKKDK